MKRKATLLAWLFGLIGMVAWSNGCPADAVIQRIGAIRDSTGTGVGAATVHIVEVDADGPVFRAADISTSTGAYWLDAWISGAAALADCGDRVPRRGESPGTA